MLDQVTAHDLHLLACLCLLGCALCAGGLFFIARAVAGVRDDLQQLTNTIKGAWDALEKQATQAARSDGQSYATGYTQSVAAGEQHHAAALRPPTVPPLTPEQIAARLRNPPRPEGGFGHRVG